MRNLALAGLLAMAVPAALAQTNPPQPANTGQAESGEPANLCHELVAFMRTPSPGTAAAAGTAAPAKPASGQAAATSSGEASASDQAQSAQSVSGQSGVAVNAPEPDSAPAGKQGSVEAAPQKSSRSAPVPTDSKGTPKESVMSLQEAEALAAANDLQGCRDAAQKMRRAGVAMPPPLLALAALDQ